MTIFIDTSTFAATPAVFADAEKTKPFPRAIPLVQGFRGDLDVWFVGNNQPSSSSDIQLGMRPIGSKDDVVRSDFGTWLEPMPNAVGVRISLEIDTEPLSAAIEKKEELLLRAGVVLINAESKTQNEYQLLFSVSATAFADNPVEPTPTQIEIHDKDANAHAPVREELSKRIDAETNRAVAQESALGEHLDVLQDGLLDVADDAERALNLVAEESARAVKKENEIASALDAETARAKKADVELAADGVRLSGLIATETSRATQRENEIEARLVGVYRPKGSVPTFADLPKESNEVGDVYNVIADGMNYAWTADSTWDNLGSIVDLSGYSTTSEMRAEIEKEASARTSADDLLRGKITKEVARLDEKFAGYAFKNGSYDEFFRAKEVAAANSILASGEAYGVVGVSGAKGTIYFGNKEVGNGKNIVYAEGSSGGSLNYEFDPDDKTSANGVVVRSELWNYLPLSGGRLSGGVVFDGGWQIESEDGSNLISAVATSGVTQLNLKGHGSYVNVLEGAEIYRDWGDYGDLSAYKDGVLVAAMAVKNALKDVVLLTGEQALTNKDLSDASNIFPIASFEEIGTGMLSLDGIVSPVDLAEFGAVGMSSQLRFVVAPAGWRGDGTAGVVRLVSIDSDDTIGVPTARAVREYVSGKHVNAYTIREIDGNSDAPESAIPLLPLLDQAYTDLTEWEKLSGKTVPLGLLSETLRAAIEHSRNPVVKKWNNAANPYNGGGVFDVPYLVDFGVVEAIGRNEYTTVFPSFSKDLSLDWCYLPSCESIEKSFHGNKSPDPNFIFPKNKSMHASFSGIANLRGFWSTNASPTDIGDGYSTQWGVFNACKKVEEIKFAGALVGVMYGMLSSCSALKTFEAADLDAITYIAANHNCTSLRDWTVPLPALATGNDFMSGGGLSSESIAFVLNSIPRWDDGKAHVIKFTGCPGAKSTVTTETFTVADEAGTEYSLENCPLFTNDDEDFSLRKAFVLAVKKKNWTVEI